MSKHHGKDIAQPPVENDEQTMFKLLTEYCSAWETDDKERIDWCLNRGADVNYRNENGKTAIMMAVEQGNGRMLQFLLSSEADIGLRDNDGANALIYATVSGNTEAVATLAQYNADLNASNNDGMTPVMLASENNDQEMVFQLTELGANVATRDKTEAEDDNGGAAAELDHSEQNIETVQDELKKLGTFITLDGANSSDVDDKRRTVAVKEDDESVGPKRSAENVASFDAPLPAESDTEKRTPVVDTHHQAGDQEPDPRTISPTNSGTSNDSSTTGKECCGGCCGECRRKGGCCGCGQACQHPYPSMTKDEYHDLFRIVDGQDEDQVKEFIEDFKKTGPYRSVFVYSAPLYAWKGCLLPLYRWTETLAFVVIGIQVYLLVGVIENGKDPLVPSMMEFSKFFITWFGSMFVYGCMHVCKFNNFRSPEHFFLELVDEDGKSYGLEYSTDGLHWCETKDYWFLKGQNDRPVPNEQYKRENKPEWWCGWLWKCLMDRKYYSLFYATVSTKVADPNVPMNEVVKEAIAEEKEEEVLTVDEEEKDAEQQSSKKGKERAATPPLKEKLITAEQLWGEIHYFVRKQYSLCGGRLCCCMASDNEEDKARNCQTLAQKVLELFPKKYMITDLKIGATGCFSNGKKNCGKGAVPKEQMHYYVAERYHKIYKPFCCQCVPLDNVFVTNMFRAFSLVSWWVIVRVIMNDCMIPYFDECEKYTGYEFMYAYYACVLCTVGYRFVAGICCNAIVTELSEGESWLAHLLGIYRNAIVIEKKYSEFGDKQTTEITNIWDDGKPTDFCCLQNRCVVRRYDGWCLSPQCKRFSPCTIVGMYLVFPGWLGLMILPLTMPLWISHDDYDKPLQYTSIIVASVVLLLAIRFRRMLLKCISRWTFNHGFNDLLKTATERQATFFSSTDSLPQVLAEDDMVEDDMAENVPQVELMTIDPEDDMADNVQLSPEATDV